MDGGAFALTATAVVRLTNLHPHALVKHGGISSVLRALGRRAEARSSAAVADTKRRDGREEEKPARFIV
jgi:hypothetical protein